MLLTLGACNTQAGTKAWAFALLFLGRHHPDAGLCGRLEQRLPEICNVTPMALVNGGRPRTVRTRANEDAIIAAV